MNLSVFFPAHNEEKNISSTVEKAINFLKSLDLEKYEVIIVDNGSKDKTRETTDQLVKKYDSVRVIHQDQAGYGLALRTGFGEAKYEWVIYTDSDGQFDFSEVTKFLEKSSDSDLIWGYRIKRSDPLFRKLSAKGWALSLWLTFGLRLKDIDCGFKMIKKEVIEKISPLHSTVGGMINAELAIKAKRQGFKITEVGVNHYPRTFGSPTGVKLNVILHSYLDLFTLWWELR